MNRSPRTPSTALGIIVQSLVICFLGALAYLTARYYLWPARLLDQPKRNHAVAGYSLLLLTLILLMLGLGLVLALRAWRWAFPRRISSGPVRTAVVDAWAEAGKRA